MAERVAIGPRHGVADAHRGRRRDERRALDVHRARGGKRDQRQREQSARDHKGRSPDDHGAPHGHTLRPVPSSEIAAGPFEALARDAARIGVRLDAATVALCARYADLLIERNTSVNLTAITTPADIATKHFLDSFTAIAVRTWTGRERMIDIGSGAGFPGLALQLALPGTQVTLVESMGKKARFLEEVTSTLALDGVEVRNERAEALAHTRRERYDVATARAVGTLGAIVEYLLPFLRVGGDAIAWKGR
ncbi:MAG: 16S rRNA (guanine(527)-N(7))-methyltransferase RsmG, partial [Actinobacteria bacterium]